ncbi:ABC transporter substrate-binding protein [Petroclostridium sp. X23]|uniref:ABC transporter substrate-binding protein n=1 Tax=Petroclostridium sp. X23 TaxID=3045146 RepID=UPI0024AD44B3|nr:ABC transporter substrate-binding protein [Petroclostridium sp. X23]WHH60992.1 ABC transporter substrate-binding protein [Petroclostridium sp. X23]
MKKTRGLLAVLLAVYLIVLQAGCGNSQSSTASNGEESTQTQVRAITDDLNRKVQVPAHPKRVLALNSSMMETLFDLGVVPVGKVIEYEIPRPEAQDLPSISNENSPNIEMITKLAPDLIIAHARNHAQILDNLEGTGAAVVYIDSSKAEDQLLGRIDLIAEVLECQSEAAAYMQKVEEKAEQLRTKIADSPIKTALFIQGGSQNIMAAQTFCFWGRLMTCLGIENIVPEEVAKTSKAGFVIFDMETIIQKDPDAILILQPGFRSTTGQGSGKGNGQENKGNQQSAGNMSAEKLLAMYKDDPMWKGLSAVKNDQIYIVPIKVSPGKINVLDALDVVAKLIVPENK